MSKKKARKKAAKEFTLCKGEQPLGKKGGNKQTYPPGYSAPGVGVDTLRTL